MLAVDTFCSGGDGDDGEIFHGVSVDRHDDAGQDFAARVLGVPRDQLAESVHHQLPDPVGSRLSQRKLGQWDGGT